jgi:hypothetical protein
MNSRALIPLSALVVAGTITFADLKSKGKPPTTQQFLGLSAIYLALSLGNDLGFTPTNGFAALLMLAVFISRGQEAFGYLSTKTGSTKKPSGNKQQAQPEPLTIERKVA